MSSTLALIPLLAASLIGANAGRAGHAATAMSAASRTFVYGTSSEPDTLNPSMGQLVPSFDVWSGVFDGMLVPDPQGVARPDLATSYSISKDSLTYTFHLRHGVKWANGQPFTSADVYFTYQQFENPKNNNFNTTGWDRITKVDVPDAYTVVFHTSKLYAPFVSIVGEAEILPKYYFEHSPAFLKDKNFNKDPFNRKPFGTGPFMVQEWKTADHITLVRNPYYWGPKPAFDKIIARIVPNDNTLLVQLKTGEIQMAQVSQAQVGNASNIQGTRLINAAGAAWFHIDLKQWGFLRDQQVRVALDYATPKQQIIKSLMHGYGTPAYGDISPAHWAYNPNVVHHDFNLAKAAAILAADGFTKNSNGWLQKGGVEFDMSLWTSTGSLLYQQVNQILKAEWGKIGVKVDLHTMSDNTIYGAGGPQFTKAMTGIGYAWYNSSDPSDAYYWASNQVPSSPTGSGGNDIAYFYKFSFAKQIDALTSAADATLDQAKRKQVFAKIQALLAEQVPVIFIDWEPLLYVVPQGLKGFNPYPWDSLLTHVQEWHY